MNINIPVDKIPAEIFKYITLVGHEEIVHCEADITPLYAGYVEAVKGYVDDSHFFVNNLFIESMVLSIYSSKYKKTRNIFIGDNILQDIEKDKSFYNYVVSVI